MFLKSALRPKGGQSIPDPTKAEQGESQLVHLQVEQGKASFLSRLQVEQSTLVGGTIFGRGINSTCNRSQDTPTKNEVVAHQ